MAKKCCICGEKKPVFNSGEGNFFYELKDGFICQNCIYKMGYKAITSPSNRSTTVIRKLFDARKKLLDSFTETRKIGERFIIDDNHKLLLLGKVLFRFDQLKDYHVFENGSSIQSPVSGIGRAVIGNVLFGGVGAIVGATTAKRVNNDVCDELMVRLIVSHYFTETMDITFAKNVSRSSEAYKSAIMRVERYTKAFDSILGRQYPNEQNEVFFSEADEILKFKKLMESGVITEEEYLAKKKQLLNL